MARDLVLLQAPAYFLLGCHLIPLRTILYTENDGVGLDLGNGDPSLEPFPGEGQRW